MHWNWRRSGNWPYEQNNNVDEGNNREVKDDAYDKIIEEDIFFDMNEGKLNCENDKTDLDLLEKYKCAQYLGQWLCINRWWKKLINCDENLSSKMQSKQRYQK